MDNDRNFIFWVNLSFKNVDTLDKQAFKNGVSSLASKRQLESTPLDNKHHQNKTGALIYEAQTASRNSRQFQLEEKLPQTVSHWARSV